jgi:hypothetical protein
MEFPGRVRAAVRQNAPAFWTREARPAGARIAARRFESIRQAVPAFSRPSVVTRFSFPVSAMSGQYGRPEMTQCMTRLRDPFFAFKQVAFAIARPKAEVSGKSDQAYLAAQILRQQLSVTRKQKRRAPVMPFKLSGYARIELAQASWRQCGLRLGSSLDSHASPDFWRGRKKGFPSYPLYLLSFRAQNTQLYNLGRYMCDENVE